ncbi:helix-turn-helix domain-containing protein [Deinococcus aquiradiocola]|uniref:Helix-turn-helix domain-containing protein n=1 Tax=Deinococcus aquiradiocola TaxID=393059 RepID=A0A917UKX6_9DEIO|nr:helix-turn-helix domain-containing protein [Deinococcus aquiradiocola]GGJ65163.1 hypothetical protein GCM10008939_06310 [Deinococcus aquiradiocola]
MNDITHDTGEMNVIFVHSSVDDYPLTPYEFRVYGKIARRAGQGIGWPSVEQVAAECLMSEDTARQALQNLTTFGLLSRQERPGLRPHYRLTRPSTWLSTDAVRAIHAEQTEKSRAKRQARKARTGQENPGAAPRGAGTPPDISDPSEKQGGVVSPTPGKNREGYPSEKHPPHPSEKQGGVSISTKGNPREGDPETGGTPPEARRSAAVSAPHHERTPPAAHAATPGTPPDQAPPHPTPDGTPPHAKGTEHVPRAAAAPDAAPLPDTPVRRYLLGYFGPDFLQTLLEEDPTRHDWFRLPTPTVQACKDDAVTEANGKRWKTPLIGLLDAQAAQLRRTERPTHPDPAPTPAAASIADQVKARIAATRRTE